VADFTSTQTLENGEYVERCRVGAEDLVRKVPIPTTHVRWSRKGAMRAYVIATGVLRLLVRMLYLFPVLIVVKIVLFVLSVPIGDLITVWFVMLVVALFAVLSIVILLMLFVGPRSERHKHAALMFHAPTGGERLFKRAAGTRIVGRIDAGLEVGDPVLTDRWTEGDGGLVRSFSGSSFVLVDDSGGTPIAVELLGCPLLVDYENGEAVVRQGERVEIVAQNVQSVMHLEDSHLQEIVQRAAGGLVPYRQTEAAVRVASSLAGEPVLIRRVP
jgi:hypothetical protein